MTWRGHGVSHCRSRRPPRALPGQSACWGGRRLPIGRGAAARGPGAGRDGGFASIVMLSLSGVLALVASVLVALGVVAVTRQRAATAADMGALAAAERVLQGTVTACAAAARVVVAVGGAVTSCRIVGADALIDVTVRAAGPLGRFGSARGHARAGPVRPRPP